MTVDDVIYFGEKNEAPKEIFLTDKKALEQLQLINEQDKEEKSILLKRIETFVSKKRFKDYLQKKISLRFKTTKARLLGFSLFNIYRVFPLRFRFTTINFKY
jgi:hypothetical protein